MFFELVATLVAGVGAAGVVMLLNRTSGGRLPRWAMPVGAGLAMIAMAIWNEYTWFDRTVATLPEGVEVISTVESRSFYRPWTYAVPFVQRFAAVDTATLRQHEAAPDMRVASMLLMSRWSQPMQLPVVYDCAENRRAGGDVPFELGADGSVTASNWQDVPDGDPALRAVCNGGA